MICFQCRTHNGMALCEEFDQITYFCFKCGTYNPSRNEFKISRRDTIPVNNCNVFKPNKGSSNNISCSTYNFTPCNNSTFIDNELNQMIEHSEKNTENSQDSSVIDDEQPTCESIDLSN